LANGEFPEEKSEQCGEGSNDVRAKYEFNIIMNDDEQFTG